MNRECHKIATRMLGYGNDDGGLLNVDLHNELSFVDDMCHTAGGQLISRQAVGIIINDFRHRHPGLKLCGD
jgi:hypothetical protein